MGYFLGFFFPRLHRSTGVTAGLASRALLEVPTWMGWQAGKPLLGVQEPDEKDWRFAAEQEWVDARPPASD